MIVLSLFDGQSCGQIALKDLGVKVDKYYASEIDKHAIKQTMLNFPDTIQLGSVTDVDVSKLDKIDLLIGGSPCTNFSFAGKRNGMSTTNNEEIYTLDRYLELKADGFQFEGESFLFWEYMRILKDIRRYNPNVKFLLENVEMGKKWERTLSEAIGIFGVHINSALVSAQNRKRIYWTNIRTKQIGLFGEIYSDIPQPEDRGILLKDVLDDGVDEKYYLSADVIDKLVQHRERHKELGHGFGAKFHNKDEKMQALKVGGKGIDDLVCVAMRGRGENNDQQLEPNYTGKTNTITSVQKDNLVMTRNYVQWDGVGFDQDNRAYFENGKSGTLDTIPQRQKVLLQIPEATAKGFIEVEPGECFDFEQPNSKTRRGRKMIEKSNSLMSQNMSFMNYTSDYRIRRLTPTECARLQTIPEWYRWECSDTQEYKMLGNGWNIETIVHILNFMK